VDPDHPIGVLARPAEHTSVRWEWTREEVFRSLWFVPLCFLVGALVLARLSLVIDDRIDATGLPEELLPGDVQAVAQTMSTVAAAMLTFLAIVLSSTLIAVQLASSQYSPRIVRIFVNSPMTKITVGFFLATFVFAFHGIVVGEESGASVPGVTISVSYLLVLVTLVMVVVYLHGIVKLLRVQYLLQRTAHDAYAVMEKEFPPESAYLSAEAPRPGPRTRTVEFLGNSGILQVIDLRGLAEAAEVQGCWIEMRVAVGEHTSPHTPLAVVHGPDPWALSDLDVVEHMLFGHVRTLQQDPAYGIRMLVDTASRALSPAINDPTTAVQALNIIIDLLARVADRPDPSGWYTSRSGAVRLRLIDDSFERLAVLGLTEILRYGAGAPQVTRRLAAAYDEIQHFLGHDATGDRRREVLRRLRAQYAAAVEDAGDGAFADVASQPDRMGLG
jgi:uncharacterized membrane protein